MTKEYLVKLCLGLYRVTERFPESEPLKRVLREKGLTVLTKSFLVLANKENRENNPFLTKESQAKILVDLLQAVNSLEILFALAQEQGWVLGQNFVILGREYGVLKQGAQEQWEGLAESPSESGNIGLLGDSSPNQSSPGGSDGTGQAPAAQNNSKGAEQNDKAGAVQHSKAAGIETKREIGKQSRPGFEQDLAKRVKPARPSLESLRKPRHRKIVQALQKKDKMQVQDFKKNFFPQVSKRTLRRDMDYLLRLGFIIRKGDKNNTFYKIKR